MWAYAYPLVDIDRHSKFILNCYCDFLDSDSLAISLFLAGCPVMALLVKSLAKFFATQLTKRCWRRWLTECDQTAVLRRRRPLFCRHLSVNGSFSDCRTSSISASEMSDNFKVKRPEFFGHSPTLDEWKCNSWHPTADAAIQNETLWRQTAGCRVARSCSHVDPAGEQRSLPARDMCGAGREESLSSKT